MKNALVFSQLDACNFSIYIIRIQRCTKFDKCCKGEERGNRKTEIGGSQDDRGCMSNVLRCLSKLYDLSFYTRFLMPERICSMKSVLSVIVARWLLGMVRKAH